MKHSFSLTLLLLLLPMCLKAEVDLRQSYSRVEVVSKTTDKSLKGQARVKGNFYKSGTDQRLFGPIMIIANNEIIDTVGNGDFDLLFDPETMPNGLQLRFTDLSYNYQTAVSGELVVQKNMRLELNVWFSIYIIEAEKPVIYLYPEHIMDVEVKIQPKGDFNFTYPSYNEGWECTVHPNGTIDHKGKTFSYLFYDASVSAGPNFEEGFVIQGEKVVAFLEDKLSHLGLNDKEVNDFIVYWAPRMVNNPWNYVSFSVGEAYDKVASIKVSPQPETLLRVFMYFKPMDGPQTIPTQQLPSVQRSGFTVVEWGGAEIRNKEKNL